MFEKSEENRQQENTQKQEEGFWKNIFSAKDSITDIDVTGRIKKFASDAVNIVSELDEELVSKNSSYEISDFKVRGTIGIVAGMILDIHYVKTPTARAISDNKVKMIPVINPETGATFNVSRVALAGKQHVNVKDPNTGDIFCIDAKTGKVLCKAIVKEK